MSLRTRLLLALAYVLVLAIVSLGIPLAVSLRDRVDAEVRSQARNQADLVAATVSDSIDPPAERVLEQAVSTAGQAVRGRVVIVGADGLLLADSASTDEPGSDFSSRPEVASALAGRPFQGERTSETLGEELLVTAVPALHNGRPAGAVRITQSVAAVERALGRTTGGLFLIGAVVLALGLAAGALMARGIAGPLRRLEDAAARVGAGDLDARAPVEGSSEQRALADTFNQMAARLSRMVRSQQDFVADASHQLRTPLAGMRLRLEEARETGDREELEAALKDLDRLSETIDELLVLSQAGEPDASAEVVDMRDVAERAIERWRAPAAAEGHALRLHAPNGTARLLCAPADVDRALDALLENAVRYAPHGTPLTVGVDTHGIEVLDHGPGVEPGEEERLFARFHRGRVGQSTAPGTGLGLPIARELMRRWGGDARIENRPEGGARARLEVDRT
jgi:two-component system, OmpR family, sensor kinase